MVLVNTTPLSSEMSFYVGRSLRVKIASGDIHVYRPPPVLFVSVVFRREEKEEREREREREREERKRGRDCALLRTDSK